MIRWWPATHMLHHVPDQYKTQETCIKAVEVDPWQLDSVPDHLKTEMCIKAVEKNPRMRKYLPDSFKTQEICDAVVTEKPLSLQYVPDWFVTQQQAKIWHK